MNPPFIHRDFSAGWCPSDDPTNGRPNGLLRMDSVELDTNGALVMTGGIKTLFSGYVSDMHTIYSKYLSGNQFRYLAGKTGLLFRNTTQIETGGSTTRAGFGCFANYVLAFTGAKRIRDDGTTATNLGQVADTSGVGLADHGSGVNTGTYEYVQVNVFNSGNAYIAKSAPSTAIHSITLTASSADVTPHAPTFPSNEVWIFRRGGGLDQFYRVLRILGSFTSTINDAISDDTALTIGITADILALSVNSTDLPDDQIEVVGPINQRMLYFSASTINFSELNSPETYVPGQSIFSCGSSSAAELFLWARKVGNNTVIVGTTHDLYVLTGTYITLPDGTLDIYYASLGCKFPPIGIDADVYGGGVVYMSADGWRITFPDGSGKLYTDARVDRMYRGETPQTGCPGIPIELLLSQRFCVAVGRSKLWCRMPAIQNNNPSNPFLSIMHVYDMKRDYWRCLQNVPDILYAQEDGAIMCWFSVDNSLREVNNQFQKTDDSNDQTVNVLFPIWNLGNARNRKDLETLKMKIKTAGGNIAVDYSTNDGLSFTNLTNISASTLQEVALDLSSLGTTKTFQLYLHGPLSDFVLDDISIDFENRPNPLTFLRVPRFDIPQIDGKRFRPRTWPFLIDTLGADVFLTPYINGIAQAPFTLHTTTKQVVNYFFKSDAPLPQDIGFTLQMDDTMFEFYNALVPEMVHVFPIAKQFDEVGPIEIFKYGKLRMIRARLYSDANGSLPYAIYFEDKQVANGTLSLVANVEDVYEMGCPKTVAGTILRIVFGPVNFNFYRYYIQVQSMVGGKDTENQWLTLPEPQQ